MSDNFEELNYQQTFMGELVLRRRREPLLNIDVFEVKLNDDFLMSSLFTEAETELARLGLSGQENDELDVLIGGLGLGYTAGAVLEHNNIRNVTVVEVLSEVIDWHRQRLVPLGKRLCEDPRCHLINGDFFALVNTSGPGSEPGSQEHLYHAILLDIDHSPGALLHPDHGAFYQPEGLSKLATYLRPGGTFGMWSNEAPDDDFLDILTKVFDTAVARIISFPNPYQDKYATATIYIARKEGSYVIYR